MSAPSPGPGPCLDIRTHESPLHPLEHHEVSESAQDQQDQEEDNAPMGPTQSESPQEESERQKLRKRLFIEPPIPRERVTTAPGTFKEIEERKTYTSFGDDGTTASVSAYGHLLQISRYLGTGHSGFFCADLPDFPGPYYSDSRLRDILRKAQSNIATIGINWKKAFADSWDFDGVLPRLEFVEDRWPRFVRSVPNQYVNDMARNSQDQGKAQEASSSCEPHPISNLSRNFSFSVQYFCNDGVIFQKCTLEKRPNVTPNLQLTQLELQADVLIRNLDFTNQSDFNERNKSHEYFRQRESYARTESREMCLEPRTPTYSYRLGPDERSLEVVHHITQKSSKEMDLNKTDNQGAVVLTIIPYVNGVLQSLNLEGETAIMDLSRPIQSQIQELGVLDVVLFYKLQFEDRIDNRPGDFENIMVLSPMSGRRHYEKISFSSNLDLDFIVRRNLEHILSVCSVPVYPTRSTFSDGNEETSPIALTCGDISGHYVGLAASFYALQFLREIDEYLETKSPSSYASTLRERIRATCKRHSRWVFESTTGLLEETNRADNSSTFAPHYWVSGQKIPETRWLPGPSHADTPLQILKAFGSCIPSGGLSANYFQASDESKEKQSNISRGQNDERKRYDNFRANVDDLALSSKSRQAICQKVVAWLQDMDQNDERKRHAFARPSSTDGTKFCLVDHVWISQALNTLKEVNDLGIINITEALRGFQPEVVEKAILERFITENPHVKKRMIATSRTAFETRFLLRSKDTALFHAMDTWKCFMKERNRDEKYCSWKYIMDEWRNTIEYQAGHEETQELKWRKPLRYALSFILASKERLINKTSPDVILSTTARVLFGMASPSGLFPGYLTSDQAPMEFFEETYRDDYWQTVFEIPYILWKYGKDEMSSFPPVDSSQSPGAHETNQEISTSKKKSGSTTKKFDKMQYVNPHMPSYPEGLVEASDDWLQQALRFGLDSKFLEFQGSVENNPVEKQVQSFLSSSEEVVSAGWHTYRSDANGKKNPHSFTDGTRKKGLIVDIPSVQKSKRKGIHETLDDNKALTKSLARMREVQLAEKRLIWLPQADKETAMVCCLASPPNNQYELSAFFDRHALYDKFFSDDISEEWKTEFQLSFYRLARFTKLDDFHGDDGIPRFSYVVPQSEGSRRTMNQKKEAPLVIGIVRAAMGFRFVGDYFDKSWTCHFVEYLPGNPPPKKSPKERITREEVDASEDTKTLKNRISSLKYIQDPHTGNGKYLWQQRKVLELLFFNQILLEIEEETKDVFSWARGSVLTIPGNAEGGGSKYSKLEARESVLGLQGAGDNGRPYRMAASHPLNPLSEAIDSAYQFVELGDSEGYFDLIGRWRLFEGILQTLGEDLSKNLEKIEEWRSRERDREMESPRWTRDDQWGDEVTLNKLRIRNRRKIRDLERLNSSIQTFRDSLTGRLESIREDMSFRGSENMSLFTYVTVVFLPLGFATGIFSMSEPPGNLTLTFMVATAITSLSITVFALANAKLLGKSIVEPLIDFVQSFGRSFISIFVVPCLFLVYSVEAVLCPVYHPIYVHTAKPVLDFLGRQEYLKRYKMSLRPIRELDWITKVHEWVEKEKKKREEEKKANDPEGQRISHETVQMPTTQPS